MDSGNNGWDPNQILGVLARGKEQTRQLETRLGEPDPSTVEMCKSLVQQIQSTFQTAISMAKGTQQLAGTKNVGPDSPQQSDSPRSSENSERSELFKKRKNMPKWSRQVGVRSEEDVEGRLEDGYSWRKYGQKDILGAKYPRGYYRCTHRNSMGCLATKQVQRSDDDASTFDVTYRGVHTCKENRTVAPEEPKMRKIARNDQPGPDLLKQLQSLKEKLRVRTEDLNTEGSSSFSFPSTMDLPDSISTHSAMENCFMGSFSPAFVSDSNYFSLSPCNYDVGGSHNLPAQETGFADMISAVNSPMADMDFGLRHHGEFEPDNFPFDGSNIF